MAKTKQKETEYPIARDGKYICSDGTEYPNAYWANEHEKQLKTKTE